MQPNYQRDYHRKYRKTKHGKAVAWKANKKWRDANREKIRATDILRYAVKKGTIIKPDKCPKCGATDRYIHGHHEDYSKPLEVDWMCFKCHRELKKQ